MSADMKTLEFTLLVRKSSRYPYVRASILGPRTRAKLGELEVPMRVRVPCVLLEQRVRPVVVDVPEPAVIEAVASEARRGAA